MKKAFFTLAFFVVLSNLSAQGIDSVENFSPRKHHSVYGELGGINYFYSVNYDYIFFLSEQLKLAVGVALSAWLLKSSDASESPLKISPIANFLYGKKSHHLEAGIGLARYKYPSFRLGYRYQRPQGGFMLRAGCNPIISSEFMYTFGFGIGYTF